MADNDQAWDRLTGETQKAFQAFTDYCLLGPGRSLRKLHAYYCEQSEDESRTEKPPTARFATLGNWSSKFNWQRRVEAFDEYQREQDRVKWEARRADLREQEWNAAQKLLAKAHSMLEFSLTREIVTDDGTTIIEPAGWSMRDAQQFVKTASEIARLAAEMAQRTVDLTSGGEPLKLYDGWTPDSWDDDDDSAAAQGAGGSGPGESA